MALFPISAVQKSSFKSCVICCSVCKQITAAVSSGWVCSCSICFCLLWSAFVYWLILLLLNTFFVHNTHLLTLYTASLAFSRTSSHQFLLFFCWGWQTLFYFLFYMIQPWQTFYKTGLFSSSLILHVGWKVFFKTQCSVVWKFWEGSWKWGMNSSHPDVECGLSLCCFCWRSRSPGHITSITHSAPGGFIDVLGSVHFIIQMN